MIKKFYFLLFALFYTALSTSAQGTEISKDQFVQVGDIKMHYKIYGKGDPIILLHGSLESMEDWDKQVPELSKKYKVITVDSRGHGQTTFTDRKMDYILLSEDISALMVELKIDSAFIVGFGDGGITGLYLSLNHPEKVRRLVAIGANYKVDTTAVYGEILDKVKAWDDDKMYQFIRNHFKGYQNYDQITQFTQRMKTMLLTEPNLTLGDLKKITCPTLLIAGDHDIIKIDHTNAMFENIPNSYMCIIPATKHYPQKESSLIVNSIILDFLNKKFARLGRF